MVLALNSAWLPVEIIDWKDAFRLLCKIDKHGKHHAKVLETLSDTYIQHTLDSWMDTHLHESYTSVSTSMLEIEIPEIIILQKYNKVPKRVITFNKENLLIRDGFECAYCGCELTVDTTTIDHVIPRKLNGHTGWDNCVSSCKQCNQVKGHEYPVGKFKPVKKLTEPYGGMPLYNIKLEIYKHDIPESWNKFIFS